VKVQKTDTRQSHKKPIKSFALQVGTFSRNENAEKMRDEMRKAGYPAFVHKSVSKGKTSYKVRVGPELEHSVLEKIKSDLKKSRKIDAYIVNHP
jgi:DedD protein